MRAKQNDEQEEEAETMWGMPFCGNQVDRRGKMMTVIVFACAAYGLTISETKLRSNDTESERRGEGDVCE